MAERPEIGTTRTAGTAVRVALPSLRSLIGGLALLISVLAFAGPAKAGPPVHLPLDELGGFNKACGAAVDSRGNVYVSSAGDSRIEVFDSAHAPLGSVANPNEPCGLAVDTKGSLYVSEAATGNVVRYTPTAYPFTGAPAYGAPTVIDSSAQATGVAVDPFNDRVYVSRGDRIDVYEANGAFVTSLAAGLLTEATGVAAYTYRATNAELTHYVFVADAATDELKVFSGPSLAAIKLRRTVGAVDHDRDPATPSQVIAFGDAGAQLTADWSNGHFFAYDDAHSVVNEFEATGAFVTQVENPGFSDAEPTGLAIRPQRDEVQVLEVPCSSGTYTLTFDGETTSPLACDSKASQIRAALEALPSIGGGNVLVAGSYVAPFATGTYAISFIEELEAQDVPQIVANGSGLSGGLNPATVVTQSNGSGPGRLYVTAGSGTDGKLFVFGPLAAASHSPIPALSKVVPGTNSVTTDDYGNIYISTGTQILVYGPDGKALTSISDSERPFDLAVDSVGTLYVLDRGPVESFRKEKVTYYTPTTFPPVAGTTYARHEPPLVTSTATPGAYHLNGALSSIGINPANDHLFVSARGAPSRVIELGSAEEGSPVLNPNFAPGLEFQASFVTEVEALGANGNVYLGEDDGAVSVVNPGGTELLARITGVGSRRGVLEPNLVMAIDQSNGHVLVHAVSRGVVEEYESSGAFVTEFGNFQMAGGGEGVRLAVDSGASSPNRGNVYVAHDQNAPGTFDLSAFGPLGYGEPPIAVTGLATDAGSESVTLNGTVDPRGFEVTGCAFEYLSESEYLTNGGTFAGATSTLCAESAGQIGKGEDPVPVSAQLSGIDLSERHRFRLIVENRFGEDAGDVGLFGPPVAITQAASPIFFDEATLRGEVDPSGLPTDYHFEYGRTPGVLDRSTPVAELPPGAGAVPVQAALAGLEEGAVYYFRLVATNDAETVAGLQHTFMTAERAGALSCPNDEYRTGPSASLPDCRAYELVTPADTRGAEPNAPGSAGAMNSWPTVPSGARAGERLSYASRTLPGFDGTGRIDGYVAERSEGPHPATGWTTRLVGPSYVEAGGGEAHQHGVSPDQLYSLWDLNPAEAFEGTRPDGTYLRTPGGFEDVGQGTFGPDRAAKPLYVTDGAGHVIFSSKAHLEPKAAPAGTEAIYDHTPGGSTQVVSVRPDGTTFAAGDDAIYLGASDSGDAIAFEVDGTLYVRVGNTTTVEVVDGPSTFAGISERGTRVFYTDSADGSSPGRLFVFDLGSEVATQIAQQSVFVNVPSADPAVKGPLEDSPYVYFASRLQLDTAGQGVLNSDNLYLWDGTSIRLVAVLDPDDFAGFGEVTINVGEWADVVTRGRGDSPTRTTADGRVLVFQSHAQLTSYDNEELPQIYRYDDAAPAGARLACVSCSPANQPPAAGATLQSDELGRPVKGWTLIPNLTEDGQAVFFQSRDRLVPGDVNDVQDVYEWKAGGDDCGRPAGCVALISSGQGEEDNHLYGMTPDGHDVFFLTLENLHSADLEGSASIYDARVEGGIPDPPVPAPCQGDACRGEAAPPPALPVPGAQTGTQGEDRSKPRRVRCGKGKRRVVRHGKARCVKRRSTKRDDSRRQGR